MDFGSISGWVKAKTQKIDIYSFLLNLQQKTEVKSCSVLKG